MGSVAETTETGTHTPAYSNMNLTIEEAVRDLMARQNETERALNEARAALQGAEQRNNDQKRSHDEQVHAMMQAMTSLITAGPSAPGRMEAIREWRPPSWDGKPVSFRDYLVRIRSSYHTHSKAFPQTPGDFYWDAIYNSLPFERRARMQSHWMSGGADGTKDVGGFFTALGNTFSDKLEKSRALDALISLRHAPGRPWHAHQLQFDELLSSSHGEDWPGDVKIQYLQKTFSTPVLMSTVSVRETEDYHDYAAEVGRIMNNYERSLEYQTQHRQWLATQGATEDEGSGSDPRNLTPSPMDKDGDTVMGATRATRTIGRRGPSHATRPKRNGAPEGKKPRAKWVSKAEMDARRQKGLCFRCGASGHRASACPYEPAVNPAKPSEVNIQRVQIPPTLEESDKDVEGSENEESGKV